MIGGRLAAGIAAAVALGALSFGTGWTVKGWRVDAQRLAAEREAVRERDARQSDMNREAARFESQRTALAGQARIITREVDRVIQTPFYAPAAAPECLDADGLRQLGAAVAGAADPGIAADPLR